MKKLLLILVAAILVLILPAGVVAAKAEANRIEFNLDVGTYKIGDAEPVSASAVLTGNLREKDGNLYLSPLKGTLMIGDVEYDISVKAEKQSDLLIHRYRYSGIYQYDNDLQYIMVNVKGSKAASYSGHLKLGEDSHDRGTTWEFFSELEFEGTVDGVPFSCSIRGPHPIID